jgi:hypothetical protein
MEDQGHYLDAEEIELLSFLSALAFPHLSDFPDREVDALTGTTLSSNGNVMSCMTRSK